MNACDACAISFRANGDTLTYEYGSAKYCIRTVVLPVLKESYYLNFGVIYKCQALFRGGIQRFCPRCVMQRWLAAHEPTVRVETQTLAYLHDAIHASRVQREFLHCLPQLVRAQNTSPIKSPSLRPENSQGFAEPFAQIIGGYPLSRYIMHLDAPRENKELYWEPNDIDVFVSNEQVYQAVIEQYSVHMNEHLRVATRASHYRWYKEFEDSEGSTGDSDDEDTHEVYRTDDSPDNSQSSPTWLELQTGALNECRRQVKITREALACAVHRNSTERDALQVRAAVCEAVLKKFPMEWEGHDLIQLPSKTGKVRCQWNPYNSEGYQRIIKPLNVILHGNIDNKNNVQDDFALITQSFDLDICCVGMSVRSDHTFHFRLSEKTVAAVSDRIATIQRAGFSALIAQPWKVDVSLGLWIDRLCKYGNRSFRIQ